MIGSHPVRLWTRRFADRPQLRWIAYLILVLIAGIFIFFPEPYIARARIVPQDTSVTAASTTSLLGAISGTGNANNSGLGALINGGKPSNDLYLIIARSDGVVNDVIKQLGLVGEGRRFATVSQAKLKLGREVDIRLLLGGVIEIETKTYDPQRSVTLTGAYAAAMSRQLALFGQQIIDNKKRLVDDRFRDSRVRAERAEAELTAFQQANNLQEAQQQLGTGLTQRADLQARIQAKQVEIATLQQFRGPESNDLISARTELGVLRGQLDRTVQVTSSAAGPSVAGVSALQGRYLDLYRNLRFAQAIYDVYARSAEQVEVEELAAESASYIQVVDPAHLDAGRQYNIWAVGALGAVVLLAFFIEIYGPVTGLFTRRGLRLQSAAVEP